MTQSVAKRGRTPESFQADLPFPAMQEGGDLPDFPDKPGIYVLTCAFGGESNYRLGEILYVGASNSLRRRIAYALAAPGKSAPHPAQGPLLKFQAQRGVAKVIFCLLRDKMPERKLEAVIIEEYRKRTGTLPKWNKQLPRGSTGDRDMRFVAEEVLDRLNVQSPSL